MRYGACGMPSKLKFSLLRSTGFVAVLLIVLVLAVQSGRSWYGLEMMKISQESGLQNHLEDLGRILQPLAGPPALELADRAEKLEQEFQSDPTAALPGNDSPLAVAYQTALKPESRKLFEDFARQARLENLTLLDETGRVLFSTSEPERVLAMFDFLELDRDQFESAMKGKIAGSPAYSVASAPLKRVYVPILEKPGGEVGAVICLTAGRDYLGAMKTLVKNSGILSAISTILILLIGWLVYGLLARQKSYERKAAHADRLTSLGTLAAGFAHEVRNPLEIIGACAEDLERTLAQSGAVPADALDSCRDITGEVERLNRLVNQFLQYSRADSPKRDQGRASVRESLGSATALLKHTADKKSIRINAASVNLAPEIQAGISEANLRQIVVNLMMNSIQATPKGGTIEIGAGADSGMIQLRFRDSGPGVPAEIRPRIFEPFFTTRAEGSGLGLAIAHQFAVGAGGALECEDRAEGTGACFVLTLPRVADRPTELRIAELGSRQEQKRVSNGRAA